MREILSELGTLDSSAHVSRIDLCADFVCHENMESWGRKAWITRGKKIDSHAVNDKFTGWSIGLGGKISCRLYDKQLEIQSSSRTDLVPLWEEAGWIEGQPIWRIEFQFMREVLAEHGLIGLDSSRSFKPTQLPDDKRILTLGISSLASFMAKNGITDFDDGLDRYIVALHKHLYDRGELMGQSAEDFIIEKVRVRGKEFDTLINIDIAELERLEVEKAARDYRRASDGE